MHENFSRALAHVLSFEGGYINHPLDPGGATNMGITRKTLEAHRGYPVYAEDVQKLSYAEVRDIYEKQYWRAAGCSLLPPGIDLALFDGAVNQGVSRSVRFLQKAAHVRADGIIGHISVRAIQCADSIDLLDEFMARRMQHYGGLAKLFRTFGMGWSRRLMTTHSLALQLIFEKETDNALHS